MSNVIYTYQALYICRSKKSSLLICPRTVGVYTIDLMGSYNGIAVNSTEDR